ncbi:hypothetical protein Pmani_035288 [Petrolisthes manimaculis]|uniref:Vitellogenin domain-containing protein n=1 Tax=Petrolisthes manimaculis TaxID=1843537 RepID=A0AAE1NM14_9EUCA|nr:hypothetical protein Pmani_035288 [Petrolisthes manimaculis]
MRPLLALLLLGTLTQAASSSQKPPPAIREELVVRWDDGREEGWEMRRDHGGEKWPQSSQNDGNIRANREGWLESYGSDGSGYGSARSGSSSSSYGSPGYGSSYGSQSSYDESGNGHQSGYMTDGNDGHVRSGSSGSYGSSSYGSGSYGSSYGSGSYGSSYDGGSYGSSSYDRSPDSSSSYDRSPGSSSSYDRSPGSSSSYDRSPDSSSSYDRSPDSSSSYDRSPDSSSSYDRSPGSSSSYDRSPDSSSSYDRSPDSSSSYDRSPDSSSSYDRSPDSSSSYDSGSYGRKYDSSTYDRGTYDSSTYDRGTYDSSTYDRGTYDSSTYDRGTYDSSNGNLGTYDSSNSNLGTYDSSYNYNGYGDRTVYETNGDTNNNNNNNNNNRYNTGDTAGGGVVVGSSVFEPGKEYVYNYEGGVVSRYGDQQGEVDESRSQQQQQHQQLQHQSTLSLRAVVTITANTHCDLKLKNGVVEAVCPDKDEHPRATNFKKGVLSAIQVSIHTLNHTTTQPLYITESDVSGECDTKYTVNREADGSGGVLVEEDGSGGVLVVEKRKEDCLRGGQLGRGSLRMELEGEVTDKSHSKQHTSASNTLAQIADTIELLSAGVFDSDGPASDARTQPQRFSHLVRLLATLQSDEDMQDVWNTYTQQEAYRSLVMDAVKVCESGPCVRVLCLSARQRHPALPRTALLSWLTSLHFHTHIHPQTVTYLMDVVRERKDVEGEALMAASSLVFQMCRNNPNTCQQHSRVFVEYSRVLVGESCGWGEPRGRHSEVVTALRALGNAGVLTSSSLLPQTCFMVVEDESEDVEVRIAAFQSLLRCAHDDPVFFKRIRTLLLEERVNQVGSYIYTHLLNLVEQPGQGGLELSGLAAGATVGLNDKFNTNTFRSSRAYRTARFSKTAGVGGSVDGDVIFTTDSYLPRHASLNLTLDLPLKSFSLLEFGGDFKGLEDHLEKLFGEGGSLETAEIKNVLKNLRPKREVSEKVSKEVSEESINALQTIYDEAQTKNEAIEEEEEESPSASLYVRVLGNELMFTENILNADPLTFIQQVAREFASPKSFQVLNQEFVSGTMLGLPLRLQMNATGLVNMTREGSLRSDSPGLGVGSVTLEGRLSPSAVVTLDHTLMVDGYASISGLRHTTTHGATSDFGGKFTLDAGRLVDAELRLPNNNVAQMKSAVTLQVYNNAVQGWVDQTNDGTTDGDGEADCTTQDISNIVGLKLCTTNSPSITPSEGYQRSVAISKADTFDKYVFRVEKTPTQVKVLLDTPGSTRNRKISVEANREPGTASGTLDFPGTKMEMQYQWSDTLKQFHLRHEGDDGQWRGGELMASLESAVDGSAGVSRFLPSFHVKVGDTVYVEVDGSLAVSDSSFGLNGSLASPLLPGPTSLEASWEREEATTMKYSASARVSSGSIGSQGRMEATTSATLHMQTQQHIQLKVDSEYNLNPLQPPHHLSFNLNLTKEERMEEEGGGGGGGGLLGSLTFKSSQLDSAAEMDYCQQTGHLTIHSNITIQGKQGTSHLVVKNLGVEGKRDMELSVGFTSPYHHMDYLARAVYKTSDNALQAEYEVKGGERFESQGTLTHLTEWQPRVHLLGGIHLELNQHVLIHAGYNLDQTQSGRTLAMVSGTVGGAGGGVKLSADLLHGQPQNISLEVTAGLNSQGSTAAAATTTTALYFNHHSDPHWQHFRGSTQLRWFDESFTATHSITWTEHEKQLVLIYQDLTFNTTLKTSPGQQIILDLYRGEYGTTDPIFKVGLEKTGGVGGEDSYNTYITMGTHTLFQVDVTHKSSERFSGHLKLLESSLDVMGELVEMGAGQVKGSGQVSLNLPSGASHTSRLTLTSAYDGVTRNVKLTHQLNEGEQTVVEVKVHHREGWLGDDTLGLALVLSTPLPGLHNASLALEFNADPSRLSYVEAVWEQFKPWSVEVTSTPGHSRRPRYTSLDLNATLQTPLLDLPLTVTWLHNLTEEGVEMKATVGMERLSTLSFSGINSLEGDTRKVMGVLEFETPWTGPVFLNASGGHDTDGFNATLDFRSSLEPVNTVLADFSARYDAVTHTTARFTLTHDQLHVRMNLDNKLAEKSFVHKFEGSANAHRVNSNLEYEWDEHYIPTKVDGRAVIMTSLITDTLDTTVSLTKQLNHYQLQLLGSYGDQTLRADHQLEVTSGLEWSSIFTLILPNQERSLSSEASFNASSDLSSMDIKFYSQSEFYDDVELALQWEDFTKNTNLKLLYGGTSVFDGSLHTPDTPSLHQANITLNLSSSYFNKWTMRWEHDLNSQYLAWVEATQESQSSGLHVKVGMDGLFSPHFEHLRGKFELSLPDSLIDINAKASVNSSGEMEVKFNYNDYILHLTSSVYNGEIFSSELGLPGVEYEANMIYKMGNATLPNFAFNFVRDGRDLLILKSECSGLFPILDAVFTLNILREDSNGAVIKAGKLHVKADMSEIQDWALKGMVKLESDFEGFEHHQANVDIDFNTDRGQIDGKLIGEVTLNNWSYNGSIHGVLSLDKGLEFQYTKKYSSSYQDSVVDRKELYIHISMDDDEAFHGNVTVVPEAGASQWSIFLDYTNSGKQVTAYIIPGNLKKYELNTRVRGSILNIDAKIIHQGSNDIPYKILQGDVNWSRKKRKRFITVKLTSDINAMREVEGQIVMQQRRRLMINANFKINNAELKTNISYIPQGLSNPGKLSVKIKNDVYWPFETDTSITFSLSPSGLESDLVMDFNGKKAWITSSVKGSLSESYLKIKTPFEGFESLDITVNLVIREAWGLQVKAEHPKVCVTLDGSISKSYEEASLTFGVHKGCNGQELFTGKFNYTTERRLLLTYAECRVKDFWKLYTDHQTEEDLNNDSLGNTQDITTDIINLGAQFSVESSYIKEGKDVFLIRVFDVEENTNHFLFHVFINQTDEWKVSHEFGEHRKYSLHVNKNYKPNSFKMDVNATLFDDVYLSEPLFTLFVVDGDMNVDGGRLEISANTSDYYFPRAHFLASYNKEEDIKGTFKATSPLGDAEGSLLFQEIGQDAFTVTADMTSSLHSFKDYYLKFHHTLKDGYHSFEVLTMQDNMEYQLKVMSQSDDDDNDDGTISVNINLLTPYEEYEVYDVTIYYPQVQTTSSPYMLHFMGMFGGQVYQFDVNHNHNPTWQMQTTDLTISVPEQTFGNASISVSYDAGKDARFHLALPLGELKLGGTKEGRNVNTDLSINITQWGGLVFLANMSLGRSLDTDLKWEYQRASRVFKGEVVLGRDFSHGNITLQDICTNVEGQESSFIYSLSYKLSDTLTLTGRYKDREGTAVITLAGNTYLISAGNVKVTTNFPSYEVLEGSWNFGRVGPVYVAEVNMDAKESGNILLKASLNRKPTRSVRAWEKMKVDILLDSSLTRTHHLQSSLDSNVYSLSASYRYGHETFFIEFSPQLRRKSGSVSLAWNIPVRGISTLTFDFSYRLGDTNEYTLKMSVEESRLNGRLVMDSNLRMCTANTSLTSPFIQPLNLALKWNLNRTSLVFESEFMYGKEYQGKTTVKITNTNNNKELDLQIKLPTEYLHQLLLTVKIDLQKYILTANTTVNNHSVNIDYEFTNGSNNHECNIVGNISGYKHFHLRSDASFSHLKVNLRYGDETILNSELDMSHILIHFKWAENFLQLNGQLSEIENGYKVTFSLKNSEMIDPLNFEVEYTLREGHTAIVHLIIGEAEYNASVQVNINNRKSSLDFHLESSENPHVPLDLRAMYDIKNFLKGRMSDMETLATITLDWGGQFKVDVTGMRSRNRSKMTVDILTPLQFLPHLKFGYSGDLTMRRSNIDLTYSTFVEWSQRMTLAGSVKVNQGNYDLSLDLTTPFPDLKNLMMSLKYTPSQVEASFVMNDEEWDFLCEYKRNPYLLAISATTPIKGFENLAFSILGSVEDGVLLSEAKLSWTNTNSINVKVKAEMWSVDVEVSSPWTLLETMFFHISLRTESEQLTCRSTLHWNERKVDIKFTYSPRQAELVSRYDDHDSEVGIVKVGYSVNNGEVEAEVEVRTPYNSLQSMEALFNLGSREHEFLIEAKSNNQTNIAEGLFSAGGGKFRVHLPTVNGFVWALEAKNKWLELDTEANLVYSPVQAPVNISFSYQIKAEEEEMVASLSTTSPDLWLESVSCGVTVIYSSQLEFCDVSSTLTTKVKNESPKTHEFAITVGTGDDLVSINSEMKGDYLSLPYELTASIPLFNFIIRDATLELSVSRDQELQYKFSYENIITDADDSSRRTLTLFWYDWTAVTKVLLDETSLEASFTYPDVETKHSLVLEWSEDFSIERFTINMKVDSPLIHQEGLRLNISFQIQRRFAFTFDAQMSYGTRNIFGVKGSVQYIQRQQQVRTNTQITSDWFGQHTVDSNIQWKRDLRCNIKVKNDEGDIEHTLSLHVSTNDYTTQLTCDSTWLPYQNIVARGKVNRDINLYNIQLEGEVTGEVMGDSNQGSIAIEGTLMARGIMDVNGNITVKQNDDTIWRSSVKIESVQSGFKANVVMRSSIPGHVSRFYLTVENTRNLRSLETRWYGNDYFHEVTIYNSKKWKDLQKIDITIAGNNVVTIESKFARESGRFEFYSLYDYSRISHNFEYKLGNDGYKVIFYIKTTFDALKVFHIQFNLPKEFNSSDRNEEFELIRFNLQGLEGHQTRLEVFCYPDPVMKWSVYVNLQTTLQQQQQQQPQPHKFEILTPQFRHGANILSSFLTYPGGKVGFVLRSKGLTISKDMQLSVYLPHEEYDVISLKFVSGAVWGRDSTFTIEARIGKLGISFALTKGRFDKVFKAVLKVNEYQFAITFNVHKLVRSHYKLLTDITVQLPYGKPVVIDIDFEYHPRQRYLLAVDVNVFPRPLLKLGWDWRQGNELDLIMYGLFETDIVAKLKSTQDASVCHFQLDLPYELSRRMRPVYSFTVNHTLLDYGNYFLVDFLVFTSEQYSFYVESQHYLSPTCFKEDLLASLGQQEIGFKTLMKKDVGHFTTQYDTDTKLYFPNTNIVRLSSTALSGAREFDAVTNFTWRGIENWEYQPRPMMLQVKLKDLSRFGNEEYTMKAEFMYPDIESIILQGNVSQPYMSPLHIVAELMDGDFWQFDTQVNKIIPEMKLSLQTDHETRRARIGLHSPVAAGALLEHRKFGQRWNLDAGVGVTLITPDIIQFHLEVDPSLNIMQQQQQQRQHTWARLTSPADKIWDMWRRSASTTVNDTARWLTAELPTALRLLVNTQTLHTIWHSETSNLETFVTDVNHGLDMITDDVTRLYLMPLQPLVIPAWEVVSSSWTRLTEGLSTVASNLHVRLTLALDTLWRQAGQTLHHASYQFKSGWARLCESVSESWQLLLYEGARIVNTSLRLAADTFNTVWTTLYLHRLHPALVTYGSELERVFLTNCWPGIHKLLTDIQTEARQRWSAGIDVLQDFLQLDRYTSILTQAAQDIGERMRDAADIFQAGLKELYDGVQEWSLVVNIENFYQRLLQKNNTWSLNNLLDKGFLTYTLDLADSSLDSLDLADLLLPSQGTATHYSQELRRLVQSITGEGLIRDYLNAASGNVYNLVVMQWKEWSEGVQLDLWTSQRIYQTLDEITTVLFGFDPQLSQEALEFELKTRGRIRYTQHLPVSWYSFLHTPQSYLLTRLFTKESALSEARHMLSAELNTLASGWETLRLPSALHPPFAATATIIGSHITTFDLHHHHFLGPCSYLLARDFVNGNFTLVGTYTNNNNNNNNSDGRAGLASVRIVTADGSNVTLHVNGSVDVTELGSAEIYRGSDESGVRVDGVMVMCGDLVSKGCTFTISGRYFGRVVGLLGRYNNEPSDDCTGPDGSGPLTPAQLATAWAVSTTPCYHVDEDVVERCLSIFLHSNSPFSPCHAFVNPKSYFYQCLDLNTRPDAQNNTTSSAVLTGSCNIPGGGSVPSGWSKVYRAAGGAGDESSESAESAEGESAAADVALVVEMANCNKGKNFQILLRLLKVQIKSEDVRYSLVKYSGERIEAATPFMNDQSLMPLLAALNPDGPKSDQGGAQAVITAARDLPWRVGVSRNIIHIGCRTCNEGDAVYQALQGNHATYHLVTKFRPVMAAPAPRKAAVMAAKLLGFDRQFVYTVRDLRKFTGNDKLRSSLEEPVGSCVVAAQASGGSVFNMNKWIPNKDVVSKKFLRVLSERVSQSTATPDCQRCQCIGGATEMKLKCRSCSLSFEASGGTETEQQQQQQMAGRQQQQQPQQQQQHQQQQRNIVLSLFTLGEATQASLC